MVPPYFSQHVLRQAVSADVTPESSKNTAMISPFKSNHLCHESFSNKYKLINESKDEVTYLRYLIVLGLFFVLLAAGCVEPPVLAPEEEPEEKEVTCRTVTEDVPTVDVVCEDVEFTEEVCGKRELKYSVTNLPKVDLCVRDGPCVGLPLRNCTGCSKAMTRCVLLVKNEDPEESGSWSVSANYSVKGAGFIKEPITQVISPNESFAFDFFQIYVPDQPITSATCNLAVSDFPVIDDCHEETTLQQVCKNITSTRQVQKEVCQ
jgi:hypothetical protein